MSESHTFSPSATAKPRPRVLCVDDEPQVLDGLALHLRRHYEVLQATSGDMALELLKNAPHVAVIVSDMRMPGMNGAAFLSRARSVAPDATRLLLTGQADLDSAIAAVNDGQIFRFLTKPCPPPALLAAVEAGATQYRLVTAERVLLEQTLHGSIKALTDVLAIVSPVSFGRAQHIKDLVSRVAARVQLPDRWQVEVASMLAPLGALSLPQETAEKVLHRRQLTLDEHRMVAKVPELTEQLLASIPRLESVRAIIAAASKPATPPAYAADYVATAAHILRVVLDFDSLEAQGHTASAAVTKLAEKKNSYDAQILAALEALHRGGDSGKDIQAVPLADLKPGMVLAEDVMLTNGALLAAQGYEVTAGFVARAANYRHLLGSATISVQVPKSAAALA